MRNWDPLSTFKYMGGAPTIHLSFCILLYSNQHHFEREGARPLYTFNKGLMEDKKNIIWLMQIIHLICFLCHMLFESGMYNFFCCIRGRSVIMPAISRFIQIVLYQGLIFYEMEFLLYRMIPVLFEHGINPSPKDGWFHRFDYFDVMIVMDFMSFLSNLLFLFLYLLTALYPTPNVKFLLMLDSDETMTRDFLDSEHKKRFLNVQLFSYFVLSVGNFEDCPFSISLSKYDIMMLWLS